MAKRYILYLFLCALSFGLSAQVVLEFPVVENNDDSEEYLAGGANPEGNLDFSSSDLELGMETFDGNSSPQLVGIRFQNVTLDADAEIVGAYIQFTVDEVSPDEPATFTIRAQMDPNPAGFEDVMNNISSRPTFATTVSWDCPTWPFEGSTGEDQRTPDLTALINELISQDGWAAGNAIVFTIEGSGMRTAESRNSGEGVAAKLVVTLPAPSSQGLLGCEDESVPEGNREFELSHISTYSTGLFDEAAAEIVDYDPETQRLFFTNGGANTVSILDISDPNSPTLVNEVDMSPYGAGVNSLVTKEGAVLITVEAEAVDGNGTLVVLNQFGDFIQTQTLGVLPDMIACAPDGSTVVIANEGEPSDDYTVDPEGSITIATPNGNITLDFTAFNDQRESLINEGVRLFGPGATVAQDLEPEYVTFVDDSTAIVVMQENNAFAVVNINTPEILDIIPFGYKNHSAGRPILNEYVLNELIDLPELGTPIYGGGQPTVFLGGFSGLYYDPVESTDELYVFYAVPDRGPNEGAVNRSTTTPPAETNLRPFKLPNYQGRVAKFILDITDGEIILDDQILLTRQDGTTPISGRGNIPGFDETPVVPADPGITGNGDLFTDDFSDDNLDEYVVFSVSSNADWGVIETGGDFVAQANGFGADEASDDWLILPVDLTNETDAFFSFFSIRRFDGGDFQILASTDYAGSGDPSSASWDDLSGSANLSPGDSEEVFSGDISLQTYAGGVVYLAFRYLSTGTGGGDGARWRIDDVNVSTTALASGDFEGPDGQLYNALPFDEFGSDFESVLLDPAGNFWM
ncbi:MAG: choice-of-anchor J domain-containing protein, partial [Bacteroidota bacterium]